ncbi:MAG: cytochrome-c peroxidase [SAR86 cluster bacterium]|uniref:Cytochrome-c peroxidase n=1 Tax=SAR86 cluster bacterium TaxID=2030880 RepID=A0A2A4X740_9GAMM|nr:MAG: cytochrome-c peroxidase [SAR86 cluster bacterium]
MKKSLLIGALVIAALALGRFAYYTTAFTRATPITNFSAPFVFGQFRVPDDNPLTDEAVELGRRLFYDVRLSGNNQFSCASCHKQHLAFTDGRQKAIGVSGKELALNSMSLVNLMWGPRHFFWNGRVTSLEEQALLPIQDADEMDQELTKLVAELEADSHYVELFRLAYGSITPEHIAYALASFQRTLISSESKYDKYLRGEAILTEQENLGRKLFMAHPDVKASLRGGNCIDCHSQFLTSGFNTLYDGFSNNGLDSEADLSPGLEEVTQMPAHRGFFKVPTLRNIALTAPYMHDGRFATLEAVLDHYNEGIKTSSTLSPLIAEANNLIKAGNSQASLSLAAHEQQAIIAFLHTLTDEQFVTAEKFSSPFK